MEREGTARHSRLQSAMEYLMTYGWAILVIAIVLGVLYYFGVFNGAVLNSACLPQAGYVCQTPLLNSSGYLSVMFAQISGSQITLTGIACTNNITTPGSNILQGVSKTLQSGNQQQIIFKCPFSSLPIGGQFSGYLWIEYSTPTQSNLVAEYATITGRVSTIGYTYSTGAIIGGAVVLGYVPITLTNSQSSATGSNFQQMLTVDSVTYANSINSAWTNVEFTTGPNAAGSTIPAWVESGNSNGASATVVWLKLSNSIAASSNTLIYMDFVSSNVMSASGPTGEAPQLSCSNPSNTISGCGTNQYAQYDNGASVFNFYDDFPGTSLSGSWSVTGGSPTIVVSNGLSMTATATTWWGIANSYTVPVNSVIDSYFKSAGMYSGFSVGTGPSGGPGYPAWEFRYPGGNQWGIEISGCPCPYSGTSAPNTWYILSGTVVSPTTGIQLITNYNTVQDIYTGSFSYSAEALTLIVYNGGTGPAYYQWVRARVYPPSGVMPSASYGAFI